MSRPKRSTAACSITSASSRCWTWACALARVPAPASPSTSCAGRWPATPAWRPSPRRAFPTSRCENGGQAAPAFSWASEFHLRSRQQKTGEERRQLLVCIEWQHMGDVLIRADDDDRALLAADPAHIEDVPAILEVRR